MRFFSPWPEPSSGELTDSLIGLAGLPDESSAMPGLLARIVRLTVALVGPADYVSVTVGGAGQGATSAASHRIAEALDLAQYAYDEGPCLDALRTGEPVVVSDVAGAVVWPRFRYAAWQNGVRASLSVPLFAASGETVASLNLYARDAVAMDALSRQVLMCYGWSGDTDAARGADGGGVRSGLSTDEGGWQLVAGLAAALRSRDLIQRALGVLMGRDQLSVGGAYRRLVRDTPPGAAMTATASAVLGHLQH